MRIAKFWVKQNLTEHDDQHYCTDSELEPVWK